MGTISIQEAAERAGVSCEQMNAWASRGVVIADQVEGEMRVDAQSVERTVERRANMELARAAINDPDPLALVAYLTGESIDDLRATMHSD